MAASSKKTEEWTKRVERYRKSNLSVRAFAIKNNIAQPSMHYWVKKLKTTEPSVSEKPKAKSKRIKSSARENDTGGRVKITLENGTAILTSSKADPEWIAKLVSSISKI